MSGIAEPAVGDRNLDLNGPFEIRESGANKSSRNCQIFKSWIFKVQIAIRASGM